MRLSAMLTFPRGYIAHPYWTAMERKIDIEKRSGVNRARSEDKRAKALDSYLKKIGMTLAEFRKIEQAAARPFYTVGDLDEAVNGHAANEIVIPAHQLYGCLAQGCDLASSALRLSSREQLRTLLALSPVFTGKTEPDGTWERFVTVTGGGGAKLSNQRGLRSNAYLGPFSAPLEVEFSDDMVAAPRVRDFITFCGREIGVGAARKMNWGRFAVSWE